MLVGHTALYRMIDAAKAREGTQFGAECARSTERLQHLDTPKHSELKEPIQDGVLLQSGAAMVSSEGI